MKIFFIILFISTSSILSFQKTDKKQVIKNFLEESVKPGMTWEKLKRDYLLPEKIDNKDQITKRKDYALEKIRGVADDIKGKEYAIYSIDEKPDLFKWLDYDDENRENIFVLCVSKEVINYYLVSEDRVKYFAAIKQGRQIYFIPL